MIQYGYSEKEKRLTSVKIGDLPAKRYEYTSFTPKNSVISETLTNSASVKKPVRARAAGGWMGFIGAPFFGLNLFPKSNQSIQSRQSRQSVAAKKESSEKLLSRVISPLGAITDYTYDYAVAQEKHSVPVVIKKHVLL